MVKARNAPSSVIHRVAHQPVPPHATNAFDGAACIKNGAHPMTTTQAPEPRTHQSETTAEVVGRLRATFNTGVTRGLDWRVNQSTGARPAKRRPILRTNGHTVKTGKNAGKSPHGHLPTPRPRRSGPRSSTSAGSKTRLPPRIDLRERLQPPNHEHELTDFVPPDPTDGAIVDEAVALMLNRYSPGS
jgi:hypothetical protein